MEVIAPPDQDAVGIRYAVKEKVLNISIDSVRRDNILMKVLRL
jgi:hypothetical protein